MSTQKNTESHTQTRPVLYARLPPAVTKQLSDEEITSTHPNAHGNSVAAFKAWCFPFSMISARKEDDEAEDLEETPRHFILY
jgi:hypothetical protein